MAVAVNARRRRYDIGGKTYMRVQPIQKRMRGGEWFWLCRPEEGRGKELWLGQEGERLTH